jgi:hypothetical protein
MAFDALLVSSWGTSTVPFTHSSRERLRATSWLFAVVLSLQSILLHGNKLTADLMSPHGGNPMGHIHSCCVCN